MTVYPLTFTNVHQEQGRSRGFSKEGDDKGFSCLTMRDDVATEHQHSDFNNNSSTKFLTSQSQPAYRCEAAIMIFLIV